MREKNIAVFRDTLKIFERGFYIKEGRKIKTKLNKAELVINRVYLPEDITKVAACTDLDHVHCIGRCGVGCENADSFSLAADRYAHCSYMFDEDDSLPILVLNLANPVHPGGGVRKGAKAQEEDLCRRSSLLLSLEHESASQYYRYNKRLNTKMGSDAVIITPKVEVVKAADGSLLDESVIVSVMTCAAPMIKHGMEGLSQDEYEKLIYERITGMLKVAAYEGYKVLVLGAFGCGAFGNDAKLVSDLFYKAMKDFDYDGMALKDFFRRIDFAVLDNTKDKYNYNEFMRNFGNFYSEEDLREINSVSEEIRGCMVGGAAGDTLVYVEKGDITKAEADAIVNPANTNLTVDSGLSKAIYMAAGPEYLDACVKLGKCKVSEALITKGYSLPCKYVIHAAGPSWKDGKTGEEQLLRKTYENILKLAEKNGIRSIALPSISSGMKGYPVNEAARVAVSAVINYVEGHPDAFDEIVWIVGSDYDKEAYENQIGMALVSKLVSSSSLNAINDILRNGKLM